MIESSFWWCDSWGRIRSPRRKANRRFAYANGKMQIVDLLFFCASWIFFRRHRNKKEAKLEEVLNKVGWDYYIGEYKEGKRHEHGWFAYIAIIYNIKTIHLKSKIDDYLGN